MSQAEYRLATTALEALGDLSLGASELMNPYMDKLIPFIITSMQDSMSVRRREVRVPYHHATIMRLPYHHARSQPLD